MAFGILFDLTTNINQNIVTAGFEVTDATMDFDNSEIVIAYDRLNAQGARMDQEKAVTVTGVEAGEMFATAQTLATQQNETVIRALYYVMTQKVQERLGVQGSIVVS